MRALALGFWEEPFGLGPKHILSGTFSFGWGSAFFMGVPEYPGRMAN
jgi:hypothetical protein